MGKLEQDRLIAKAAVMYYEQDLRQSEIARRLGVSQPQVSRLLEQAKANGIIQFQVMVPDGLHLELEEQLEDLYGLREAHVVDTTPSHESELIRDLGRFLAHRLPSYLADAEVVGFTSWSRSLRETIDALTRMQTNPDSKVVEMLGDVGPPRVQHDAALQTEALAEAMGGTAHFLRVPGVVANAKDRKDYLKRDQHVRDALALLDNVDVALSGIGTCEIVPPLVPGDNFFTEAQFAKARKLGAVGQVNLRFISADGTPIESELDDLVIGISLDQLKNAGRKISVAGGTSKVPAIRGSLLGGWVDTLVTDVTTAQELVRS